MRIVETKFMRVFDHENGKIDLTHLGLLAVETTPTEFHFKSDGATDGKPSLAIVMHMPHSHRVCLYGQMSLVTLAECLAAVGYKIEPNDAAPAKYKMKEAFDAGGNVCCAE